jgi:hypothetical protein
VFGEVFTYEYFVLVYFEFFLITGTKVVRNLEDVDRLALGSLN